MTDAEPGHTVMSSTAASVRNAFLAGLLAAAVGLLAQPAGAQTSTRQTGPPQPPPAPKVSAPQSAPPKTAGPQAAGQKPPAPKAPAARKPSPPQTSRVWKGRGFVVVGGGAQLAAPGYTSTATFKLHAEDATVNVSSKVQAGPVFSVRGGMRVWKNLAIGADVGVASTSQRVDVTGRLPHPFMFNQFREVEGTASGLDRFETMLAIEASWLIAVRRRVDMFLFAGPAYINVRQDMVTRIQFTESYPFDSASFTGVESTSDSGGAVGVTAGADVAYLVSKSLGVGGQLRYSYASATLRPAGQPATVVGLGGLQLSVSGRVLF
jgi:hypothetical protein